MHKWDPGLVCSVNVYDVLATVFCENGAPECSFIMGKGKGIKN